MKAVPFQVVVETHAPSVFGLLVALVGRQDADDVFQETFTAALRAYPRFRQGTDARAWLLAIARNKAIDHHRARARRPVPAEEVDPGSVDGHELPDDALWDRVRALPERQRQCIALRFAADLAYAEIAALLGGTEQAARRAVADGLASLRKEAAHA